MFRTIFLVGLLVLASACRGPDPSSESSITTNPASSTTAAPTSTTLPATTSTTPATTLTTSTTTTTLAPLSGYDLTELASQLSRPTFVTAAPGSSDLFIVGQKGRIRRLGPDATEPEIVLDISDRVGSLLGVEPGLLGLAFHPDYAANGRFFLYYSDIDENTVLSEFSTIDGVMDPDSERVILQFEQPTNRHNGGMLAFGPDGYLFLGLGDGGAASVHSQDPTTLLASMLRLDVDDGDPYRVPPDNPFVGSEEGADEVFAYGLRNPWRYSIDHEDRLIYIGDVGQDRFEEVSVISVDEPGHNLGWIAMEGTACFQRACVPEEYTPPVLDYSHSDGCSITGGYVYRGKAIPELDGTYFYAD
ncbi:MAG: glucose dehydrogenase, partial [Acidimicrobiia bacterium]|nr:glucose dehydrogenase [Acidimicrobiia bacterium]